MNDEYDDDDDSDPVENDNLQDESPDSTPAQAAATPAAGQLSIPLRKRNPILADYLDNQDKLKQAQQQAENNRTGAGLAAALSQIGHGLSHAGGSADLSGANALMASANAPITDELASQNAAARGVDVAQQIAQTDPDSDESKSARATIKASFKDLPALYGDSFDQITAADLPHILQVAKTKAEIASRQEVAGMRADAASDRRSAAADLNAQKVQDKQNKQDEDTQAKISKDLNSLTASSRSALGTAAKAKISAARLSDIAQNPSSTPQDMQSAFADLNNIVAGSTTQGGTEHQSYNTLNTQLAQAMQYITSNPQAVDIPEIKKHVADVAARMTKISDDVVNRNTAQVQSGRSAWIKRHPDDWQNMVTAATGSDGADQSAAKRTVTNDQLQKYATTHNITPDAAGAWLKSQGYQLGQ